MNTLHTTRAVLLGAAMSLTAFAPSAPAATYRVLHHFNGTDGSYANGNLQFDAAGNLYGTTPLGGSFNQGTVYKITPTGQFSTVYSFTGGSDGGQPQVGLTFDRASGDFYGVDGGGPGGGGVIFKLTPDGSFTAVHNLNSD